MMTMLWLCICGALAAAAFWYCRKYNELYRAADGMLEQVLSEERIEISEKDGKKVIQTVKQVIPDTTAIIFWLKNRRPGKWRSDPQENGNTAQAGAHSALIAAIRERRHAN